MAQTILTSPEEYLATSYEDGDREFVDAELMKVNAGDIDHGTIQLAISSWFFTRCRQLASSPSAKSEPESPQSESAFPTSPLSVQRPHLHSPDQHTRDRRDLPYQQPRR